MSRTLPPRTDTQQRDHDRVRALRIGTPAAMRDWAARYQVPLFHLEDDEVLLISIHEARIELLTGAARRASLDWLAAHRARIITAHGGTP